MAFPGSSLPPSGKAQTSVLALHSQFSNLVMAGFQRIVSHLSIRQKIGYGYAFVIGVAVLGIGTGLSIGEYYRYQAGQKLAQTQAAEYILSRWQIAVLETKNHQQELIYQLGNPEKFDNKQFEDKYLHLLKNFDKIKDSFSNIKSSKSKIFQDSTAETVELEKWLRTYGGTPQAYRQQLEAILKQLALANVERQAIPAVEASLRDFNNTEVAIQFEGFAQDLTNLIEVDSQEEKEAAIALENIDKLRIKIISSSMLLSITIACVIATYTSRAIASPVKRATKDAQQISENTNCDLLVLEMSDVYEELRLRKQAEAELLESQRQLRLALNASGMGVWNWEIETTKITCCERMEVLLGFAPGSFNRSYESFLNHVHPDDRDDVKKAIAITLEQGADYESDYRIIWPDGTVRWLRTQGDVLRDEAGKIVGMAGTAIDMTESKRIEEELRQSEARFRELARREALLNQLASQIRRSLDLNTILETAVQEIRNLLQIDRCMFLWYRPEAATPLWEVVQESKTSAFRSIIGHRMHDTQLGPLTARVLDKQITRVDNARALTDRVEQRFFFSLGYTALLALPIHTTSGEIGVVTCGHSSGPRPWRDSEVELLQAVADQLAIAIDQAELYKRSHIAAQAAQEQATKLEQALRELQQAQAQLVQSEKMSSLGQLVAGITHEINNPINFIYGNLTHFNQYAEDLLNLVQLYQQYYPYPVETIEASAAEIDLDFIKEDLPKVLCSMKSGVDRISQIILSLRNFSRLDEAEMKWVDIHEGLDNTLLILSHRLKAPLYGKEGEYPGIQVIKDYGNLPNVQCYPGQLNQVFMNILTNAIESIDEYYKKQSLEQNRNPRGTILICTEVLKSNQLVILISDNGPGMTPEVNRRLFDPFFTTKPVGSGTGLGLSISYQIVVEKHGGQLQCISAPGQGAAFLIQIPIEQQTSSC
jgi:PAS domain S-box-containing protein